MHQELFAQIGKPDGILALALAERNSGKGPAVRPEGARLTALNGRDREEGQALLAARIGAHFTRACRQSVRSRTRYGLLKEKEKP
jgi:hypothetical protein